MILERKNLDKLKEEITEVGKLIYDKGLSPGTSGNISIRLGNNVLISPSGFCLGEIDSSSVVIIDMDGNIVEGSDKPSSEKIMHLEIYKSRNDINSIIHAHPPKATAFAVAGISLDSPILSEAYVTLGQVPVAEYATPSSEELAHILADYFLKNDSVLLANHGVVVGGKKLKETFFRLETLELYAEVSLFSKILGNKNELSPDNLQELKKIREELNKI